MKVYVNNIKVYAYHGCLDEEGVIGSDYRVDAVVDVKNKLSHQNDDLNETVDYSLVTQIVVEEMAIRSKLIETVAAKIIKRVHNECAHAESLCPVPRARLRIVHLPHLGQPARHELEPAVDGLARQVRAPRAERVVAPLPLRPQPLNR